MHQAALLGQSIRDAEHFGWEVNTSLSHNWEKMREAVQNHIGSLNFNYRVQLRTKKVTYINAYAEFVGPHKIKCTDNKGNVKELTAKYFVIATGGRPKYPDVPGVKEYCISSDDLFSLPYCPGKTLTVGASYVSLECAGFLHGLGLDVTVMVRSILLRGFDQQMAELAGDFMKNEGIKFIRPCVPTKIEKLQDGSPGLYRVTGRMNDGQEIVEEYNTILYAVGRDPCTSELNLDAVGVNTNPRTGYVICNDDESTSCSYIFAVGDIVEGRPELTPVAIQAGQLLVRRLFNGDTLKCDYTSIPTTIFTPLEYGCIGLTEEAAIE
jgi:thioredoxin reductase (NADPH)